MASRRRPNSLRRTADDGDGHETEHDAEEHQVGAVTVGGDGPEVDPGHRPVGIGHDQGLIEEHLVEEHGEGRGREGEVQALEA